MDDLTDHATSSGATGVACPSSAYDELDELYDEWCAGVVEDAPFYLGLAGALASELDRPLVIAELGAGSGRITLPLAAAGHSITAIDLAGRQLQRLEQRAAQQAVDHRIRAVERDMRELDQILLQGSCDLVIAPFRALLHVTSDRDELFAAVRRALLPGGVFAFDVFHPGADMLHRGPGEWLVRRHARTETGRWRFEERASCSEVIDDVDGPADMFPRTRIELEVRCTFTPSRTRRRLRRGDRVVRSPQPGEPHVRLTRMALEAVPAHAWQQAIERSGLALDGAYGWFDGTPLSPGDDDSAWVARAPAG